MGINSLFLSVPPFEVIQQLCACFDLASPDDTRLFDRISMKHTRTVEKLSSMVDTLSSYYMPCKRRVFLDRTNITHKRAVTVLRQFLKLYNYRVDGYYKGVNRDKLMQYQIRPLKSCIQVNHAQVEVKFH